MPSLCFVSKPVTTKVNWVLLSRPFFPLLVFSVSSSGMTLVSSASASVSLNIFQHFIQGPSFGVGVSPYTVILLNVKNTGKTTKR